MNCIVCNSSQAEYRFSVLEVHTLHVRDFDGEKLIQSLGEERVFSVCAACVSEEMRAVRFPAGRILRRCVGFALLLLAGIVLTLILSLREVMFALRALGPMAMFAGAAGIVERVRETLRLRKTLAGMSESEVLRFSAWQCVLKSAPQKYNDNDITYIPAEEASSLSPEELAVKYNLLLPVAKHAAGIARKLHKENLS